jgi:hypothetical protein
MINMFLLFVIHFTLIRCYCELRHLDAIDMLKLCQLKATRYETNVMLLSLMNPMLHLLSTRCTCAGLFSYLDKNPGWITDGANSDYYSYFPEDY